MESTRDRSRRCWSTALGVPKLCVHYYVASRLSSRTLHNLLHHCVMQTKNKEIIEIKQNNKNIYNEKKTLKIKEIVIIKQN